MITTDQKKIKIFWHKYKYLPYEKRLAMKEVNQILKPNSVVEGDNFLELIGNFKVNDAKKLVYFSYINAHDTTYETSQRAMENSVFIGLPNIKRQSTRYSVHGLHEYKGKFNPQIVKAILNILNIKKGAHLIDPFCGSGTTIVEGMHSGINGTGLDINPMAVYISQAKIQALKSSPEKLIEASDKLLTTFKRQINKKGGNNLHTNDKRLNYLERWFDKKTLFQIELIKQIITTDYKDYKKIFLVLISDLLREYSLQEPSDLRIRKRFSPLPNVSFFDAVKSSYENFLNKLLSAQGVQHEVSAISKIHEADIQSKTITSKIIQLSGFDVAITSPPYANALPYIDTQRLSLVWLNLCEPNRLAKLESKLIGGRDFRGEQKKQWLTAMTDNRNHIPKNLHNYCLKLENSLGIKDGFRRQATPKLIYKYFSEMKNCFSNMQTLMKKDAKFALVVGKNQTTLGGNTFLIDTPLMLSEIAESVGWEIEEITPLETYKRFNLHKKNSVKEEALIILNNRK